MPDLILASAPLPTRTPDPPAPSLRKRQPRYRRKPSRRGKCRGTGAPPFRQQGRSAGRTLSATPGGSDQVAILDGNILGKPHTPERAIQQLRDASGKSVTFLHRTGPPSTAPADASRWRCRSPCTSATSTRPASAATSRSGTPAGLRAGSFKAEGLGVSLLRSTEGEDATSLVGLPLIRLVDMLLEEGVEIP